MSKENQKVTCKRCGAELAAGAKFCPQCGVKHKAPFYKRPWFIVLIVIIVIAAIGGSRGSKSTQKNNQRNPQATISNNNTNTRSESQTSEITYTAYEVSELMNDLDRNALSASEKYSDQYVELTGRLDVIDSSGKYISIVPTDDDFAILGVMCYIRSDEQKAAVMDMATGDTLIVKGGITKVGEVLGYHLDIDEVAKATNSTSSTSAQPESQNPETTYTAYEVSELMNDLDRNALSASAKYSDQYVELTGRLNVIDSSGKYISIVPTDDDFAILGVHCNIQSEEQKNAVMGMVIGDTLIVKGRITNVGEVLGYFLDIDEVAKAAN